MLLLFERHSFQGLGYVLLSFCGVLISVKNGLKKMRNHTKRVMYCRSTSLLPEFYVIFCSNM